MIRVCSAAQMRDMDRAVIEGLGLPGIALMELASRAVAEAVRARFVSGRVVVVCGAGNNGGDGWGAARWLKGWGIPVAVWPIGEPKGGDAAIVAAAARRAGVPEVRGLDGASVVVDALFGTGLDREIGEPAASAIRAMDAHGAPIVAVDLPSGLHADSGAILGVCARAVHTVTFGRPKLGMLLGDGPARCGAVEVVDIGLAAATGPAERASAEIPEDGDVRWPVRPVDGHKRTNGHLLVVAGSAAMTGAAVLVCRGALAAGVGLVTLAADGAMRPRLGALPPEVMVVDRDAGELAVDPFDAVAIGPGLAGGPPLAPALAGWIARQWAADERPWVADADALVATVPSARARVLTPHPGEAARLLGRSVAQVERDRLGAAAALTERGVVLLKGPRTVIAARDALPSLNPTGAPALATGGSGDVLTGVLGALLARGVPPRDAAVAAAYVHGRAGERLWAARREGWTASDIAAAVADAAPAPGAG